MIAALIDLATAGLIIGGWFALALIVAIPLGRLLGLNDLLARDWRQRR